ncbi:hypothetical protein VP424E501_P0089 [Vibrio phage 424E50-1]|nr:hypothetical protein VP424E501_P0089 [Vibrio phage 424E50-1]
MENTRKFRKGQVRMINNGHPKEQGQWYVILNVVGDQVGVDILNLTTDEKDYWDIESENLHTDIVVM